MKKLFFIFLIFTSFCCNTYAQGGELNCSEDTIVLFTPSGELSGALLTPLTQRKIPVVIIIPGSGPTDRDGNNPKMKNNSLKYLAEALCIYQIASLRYDKRGVAASSEAGKAEKDLRFEDYVSDAVGWINQLHRDDRFNKVIIIGHSEGSLIGMLASQQSKTAGFISLAGPAESADKLIKTQLKNQPEEVRKYTYPIIDSLVAGKTVDSINVMYNALLRPSVQPYLISWFKYTPKIEIGKLKVPILIINGTTDIQIDPQNAFELLYSSKNVDLEIIEGMNHILKRSETDRQKNIGTYNNPDLPVMDELIQAIVNFIKTRT